MKIVRVPPLKAGQSITINIDGQSVTAIARTNISDGQAVVYRNESTGQVELIGNSSHRIDRASQISQNRPTRTGKPVYPIKLLAYRNTDDGRQYIVGGDRDNPLEIYEPIKTYPNNRQIYANIANMGKKEKDWIVGLQWEDNRIIPTLPERFEGSGWGVEDIGTGGLSDLAILAIISPSNSIEFNKSGEFLETAFARFAGAGYFTIDSFKDEKLQLYYGFTFVSDPNQLLLARDTKTIISTNTLHQDNWRQVSGGLTNTIIYAPSSLTILDPPEGFNYSSAIINSAMVSAFVNPSAFSSHINIRNWFINFVTGSFQGSVESGGINSFMLTAYPAQYNTEIGVGVGLSSRYFINAIASNGTALRTYAPRISLNTTNLSNPIHSVVTQIQKGSSFPDQGEVGFTYVLPSNQSREYTFTLGTRSRRSVPPQDLRTEVLNVTLKIQEADEVFKPIYTFSLEGYEENLVSLKSSLAIADCEFADIQNNSDRLTGLRDFYISKATGTTTELEILGVVFPVIYELDDYRNTIHAPSVTSNGVLYTQSTRINNALMEIPYLKFKGVDGSGIVAVWRYTAVNTGSTFTETYSERYYFVINSNSTELTDLGDFFLEGSTFTNSSYTEIISDGFLNIYSDTSGITLKGNKLYKVELPEEKADLLKNKKTKLDVTTYSITEEGAIAKTKTEKVEVLPIKTAEEIVGASYYL